MAEKKPQPPDRPLTLDELVALVRVLNVQAAQHWPTERDPAHAASARRKLQNVLAWAVTQEARPLGAPVAPLGGAKKGGNKFRRDVEKKRKGR